MFVSNEFGCSIGIHCLSTCTCFIDTFPVNGYSVSFRTFSVSNNYVLFPDNQIEFSLNLFITTCGISLDLTCIYYIHGKHATAIVYVVIYNSVLYEVTFLSTKIRQIAQLLYAKIFE